MYKCPHHTYLHFLIGQAEVEIVKIFFHSCSLKFKVLRFFFFAMYNLMNCLKLLYHALKTEHESHPIMQ